MNETIGPDVEPAEQPAEQPAVSDQEAQMALDNLRSEQNLPVGAIAGALAAVGGAGIWALVTVMTEYQIGWMAIGIGFLVGISMRFSGKGIDPVFGIGADFHIAGNFPDGAHGRFNK